MFVRHLVNLLSLAVLLAVLPSSHAAVSVTGQCEVTLLKGTTTIGKGTGTTEQQAWFSCIAMIPQPSTATSGTVSYTCQTPKCKYVAAYTPDPQPSIATLSWIAPTANTDGSPIVGLTGYRIYYGNTPSLNQSVIVGLVTRHVFTNLAPGTWCFVLRSQAVLDSEPTDPVCKVF